MKWWNTQQLPNDIKIQPPIPNVSLPDSKNSPSPNFMPVQSCEPFEWNPEVCAESLQDQYSAIASIN